MLTHARILSACSSAFLCLISAFILAWPQAQASNKPKLHVLRESRNPPVGRRLLVAWPESHAMHSVSVLRCYARLTQVDLQNSSQAPGVSFGSFRIFLSFSRCIALFLGSTPGGTESCGAVFAPAFADNSRSELSIQKTSFVYL